MIDIFSLLLSHGLLLLVLWRLTKRDDLDDDAAVPPEATEPTDQPSATRPFDYA
ncbi:hypothetical protein [Sphingobium subterraneum]|uniref:Uncharacterized protein n=1 Tax=Sphingobium subterraneum TaxID=627688 RepID=A0A841IXE5_9SPHN|nr:hypothetical protein [Sphingobium subterraneum]MBB6123333.1 hypothetical protein [Sphingobium subterraneum]